MSNQDVKANRLAERINVIFRTEKLISFTPERLNRLSGRPAQFGTFGSNVIILLPQKDNYEACTTEAYLRGAD